MTLNSKPAGSAGGLSFLDPQGDALPRPHGNTYWLWAGHVLAGEHPAKVVINNCLKDCNFSHWQHHTLH